MVLLVGCGGDNKGNGAGGQGYTHNQLAEIFVDKLNATGEVSVQLVKKSTEKYNYIVVLDRATDEFNAYRIDGYTPDQDPLEFLASREAYAFYDLDEIPGYYETRASTSYDIMCECHVTDTYRVWVETRYRDRKTNTYFEKVEGTPKDRLKVAALEQGIKVGKMAESISANYGLSAERSLEVAKLTYLWKTSPRERMTDADHDRFAKEILGHTITEFKAAAESGSRAELDRLIESSARVNGITPEQANEILDGLL